MLQLGDKKISELYLGEKKVSEVYLGEKKIRPVGPWEYTPTDWDFIYAPLRKDFKNYAWVGKPGHIDITPIQWVDIKFWAAYFNGDGMAEIWNQSRWSWKKIKTYSFRCKYINENFIVLSQKTWDVYMFQILSNKTASNNGKGNNRDSLLDSSKKINKLKWNHFVLTQTNVHPNIIKMYLNWEKYEEKTLWSFDRAPEILWGFYWYSTYKLNWFISDLIISWDYWDDDKVKRYYEKSKSRYQYIDVQYPDDIVRAEFQHRTVWLWTGTYQNRASSEKWYSFTGKSNYDKTTGNPWVFCTYWIKPNIVDSNTFLSVGAITKGYSWYLMWHHSWLAAKKNVVQFYDWATWRDVPASLPVNQRSNLAYWYENWKFKVYVNGNLIHTENIDAPFRSDYEPAITYWQCEMAGFHILKTPLTEAQVKEHYNKTKDRFELNHIGELLYSDTNYHVTPGNLIYKKSEELVFDWSNSLDTNVSIPQGSFTVSLEFKTTHDYRWANGTWWTILGKYYWPSTREAFILWVSCREREWNKLGVWVRDLWAVQCWDYIESKQVNDWQWHKAVVARDSVSKQFVFNVDRVNYDTETINYWNFWPNSLGIWAIKDNWRYKNYFRWSMKNITITKEFRPTWYF